MAMDGTGLLSALSRRVEDWREEAEERGRRAGRDLGEARDDAWRRGGEAKAELRRLWSQMEDVLEREVGPRSARYGRMARRYAAEGRDRAMDAADYVRDATRARPLMAIGVAVAATWLVASLMKRR